MTNGLGTLSLVMLVKDEAACIGKAIDSVKDYVDEIVVLDTGSTDNTVEICKGYEASVIQLVTEPMKFDFGEAYTAVSWLARGAYILRMDADETLTGGEFLLDVVEQMDRHNWEAVSIPRRRWMDLAMTIQLEKEAYPDWQPRLYRNSRRRFMGAIHEVLVGVHSHRLDKPLCIEHFVDVFHLSDPVRAEKRMAQHMALARKAGVPVEGSQEAMRLAGLNDATDN
jgi:glycosyltransferase involved in cell wall biosynthesis